MLAANLLVLAVALGLVGRTARRSHNKGLRAIAAVERVIAVAAAYLVMPLAAVDGIVTGLVAEREHAQKILSGAGQLDALHQLAVAENLGRRLAVAELRPRHVAQVNGGAIRAGAQHDIVEFLNLVQNYMRALEASGGLEVLLKKWFENAGWLTQLP